MIFMKKFIIGLLLCTTLCSCGVEENKPEDINEKQNKASNSLAFSANPEPTRRKIARKRATPSPAPTIKPIYRGKVTPGIVIDETGKERKLKLGNVNVKDVSVNAHNIWFPTNYVQVANNHYYYLRTDGERNYTIYQDKGKKAGEFSLKKGMIDEFILYNNKFYAVVKRYFEDERGKEFVEIDLGRHIAIPICKLRFNYDKGKNTYVFLEGIYDGICYWKSENGRRSAIDLKKRKVVKNSIVPQFSYEGTFIDGKIYSYKIKSGKKIQIYSLNVNNLKRKKVLEFESACKLSEEDAQYMEGIEIDEDYIYCRDYLIPRRGGEITKLPDRIIKSWDKSWIFSDDPFTTIFTHNKKFIFYMDGRGKIHRVNKKTREDVIMNGLDKVRLMDIKCTDDGVYAQVFHTSVSPTYICDWDDDFDYYGSTKDTTESCSLYYMDCNGGNVKKIWKGV